MEGNHHSGPDGFAKEIKHNHSLSNKKISTKPILFFFLLKILSMHCHLASSLCSPSLQIYHFIILSFFFLKNLGAFD